MGIRFLCPNGHKLNVKAFQAGRRGICPFCGAKFQIPTESTLGAGYKTSADGSPGADVAPVTPMENPPESNFEENLEAHLQQAERATSQEVPAPVAWSSPAADSNETAEEGMASSENANSVPPNPEPTPEPEPSVPVSDGSVDEQGPVPAPPSVQSASQPDPLSQVPDAVWYVRPPSGGQFGPAQTEMMRGWLTEGRVSPETLVWREGWADWKEAGSVFPQLQPTAAAIPEAPPVAMANGNGAAPYRPGTRRKNVPNMGLIAVLVAAVVLLLLVLIWVLAGGARGPEPEHDSTVAVSVQALHASEISLTSWILP